MTKEHFLAGYEFSLDASEKCQSYLLTQAVHKETALNLPNYIHLTYDENDLLKDAKIYTDGELETDEFFINHLQAENGIGKLKYHNLPIHTSYCLIKDKNGLNQLGGDFPKDFIVPNNKLAVPFQYLGYLDNRDPAFKWLPFPLHLICPIYLSFEYLFLDYSNPLAPTIINQKQIEDADSSFKEDFNSESEIVFSETNFRSQVTNDFGFGLGNAGLPKWIQSPEIPRCPKTNLVMMFLCQFDGDGVETKHTNLKPNNKWNHLYYKKMNFWGDGELFVFFDPRSKVACYFIQNT